MNSRMNVNNKGYIIGITTIGVMWMLCCIKLTETEIELKNLEKFAKIIKCTYICT